MQIVINIPEKMHKALCLFETTSDDVIQIPVEVIKNGTVLTKHGRLIDAEELYLDIQTDEEMRLGEDNLSWIRERIFNIAPTILEAWGNEE